LVPVLIDVTDHGTIAAARADVERTAGVDGLDGLVNNAGVAVAAPLEYVPIDELRRQFEVNVTGQIAVTQAFLPLLRQARGRVVFMGSIGGRMSVPFLAPYCASKFALEAIADSMRVELQPWGIHVALIEPGSIATPIWDKSGTAADAIREKLPLSAMEHYGEAIAAMRHAAAETGRRGIPADAVARAVEHALTAERPRTRYLVGRDARIRGVLAAFIPDRIRDRLVTAAMKLPRRGPRGRR
jgi:NAD(P)-dependent dehydrogenase (short-subunit alcohol dehydrogenase family)